jgi:predicted alpha/beta superfamily hydrolase
VPTRPRITQAAPAFVSRSARTGTDYRIYVDAPDPGRTPGPWPAVLLMDGDFLFDFAVGACRSLVESGRIPPTAVVGVGYGASFGEPGNFRGRDYTPTPSADEPTSGGADQFLDYLAGSLWHELSRRYPLREKGRALAGHSVGSLFVLYALFHGKPFFDLALASAPSIWWDDRSLLRLAAERRTRSATLRGHLYLCVGADDTPSMTGDLELLGAQLAERPFKGLKVESAKFSGHDHYNVVPTSLREGLAALLGKGHGQPGN